MQTELWLLLDTRDECDTGKAEGLVRLNRFLNWSYARVQRPSTFDHVEKQSTQTITLATGTSSYTLTLGLIDHIRYPTVPRVLTPMTQEQLDETTIASGPPTRYARWGSSINLDFVPTATENGQSLVVYGWTTTATLATSPASILSPDWDEAIVYGAAWRGWRSLGDQAKADIYREEYAALVNDARDTASLEARNIGWRNSVGTSDYQ